MSEITRYDIDQVGHTFACLDGGWIFYPDHLAALEAVKAENHQLRKELMIAEQGYGEPRLRYYYEHATKRAEKAEAAIVPSPALEAKTEGE